MFLSSHCFLLEIAMRTFFLTVCCTQGTAEQCARAHGCSGDNTPSAHRVRNAGSSATHSTPDTPSHPAAQIARRLSRLSHYYPPTNIRALVSGGPLMSSLLQPDTSSQLGCHLPCLLVGSRKGLWAMRCHRSTRLWHFWVPHVVHQIIHALIPRPVDVARAVCPLDPPPTLPVMGSLKKPHVSMVLGVPAIRVRRGASELMDG